ncbi:MAG: 2-dehydro-3-deoxygalactonokinase [Ahrensia sp.]
MPDIAFVAVDWGTTHFRAWSVDRAGMALSMRHSSQGMSTLRRDDYGAILEAHLEQLGAAPDVPVVICGMAGSRQGWREAAYLPTPCKLDRLGQGATRFEMGKRAIAILPGVAQRHPTAPDVMRSEETQVLGLVSQGVTDTAVCMPGTHTKWVRVAQGAITDFHTAMVGDLFCVLKRETILRHSVDGGTVDAHGEAFAGGVRDALAAPHLVLPSLFQLRAGGLLFDTPADATLSRLSGLLIGLDIAALTHGDNPADQVQLVGGNALGAAYRTALHMAGIGVDEHDGEALALAGLVSIGGQLWPERMINPSHRKTA